MIILTIYEIIATPVYVTEKAYLWTTFVIIYVLSVFSAVFMYIISPPLKIRSIGGRGVVDIKTIRPSLTTRLMNWIFSLKSFKRAAGWMASSISDKIIESGQLQSASYLSQRYLAYATIATPICAVLAIIIALLVSPLGALLIIAPVILVFFPRFSTTVAAKDRNTLTDKELGTFLIYAAGQQSSGGQNTDLLESFKSIIPTGLFRQLKKEAELILRNCVMITHQDKIKALEEVGMDHPSRRMRDVLIGYVSEFRTGQDIAGYLESMAEESFKDEQFRWKSYSEKVSSLAEIITMSLLLFPAAAAIVAVMAAGTFGGTLMIVGIFLSPLLAIILVVITKSARPGGFDNYVSGDVKLAVIGTVGGLIIGLAVRLPIVPILVLGVGGAMFGYGIKSQLLLRTTNALEKGMPAFLGDISEMMKLGFNMNDAIKKIVVTEAQSKYSGALLSFTNEIKRQIVQLHTRMSALTTASPSWLARYTLFMVSRLSESGGSNPSQLDKIRKFVADITRSKREALSSIKIFMLLAYATPFIVFAMTGMINAIAAPLAATSSSQAALPLLHFANINPILIQGLAASSTISITFAMMYAADLTPHNTMRIAIGCMFFIIAFYTMPLMMSHFSLGGAGLP